MDCYDEHPVPVPVNFQTHTKRSLLNELINQIYLMGNCIPPNVNTSAENDKYRICNILDRVLAPPKLPPHIAAIKRVRRRLFYDTRETARKMAKPKRKQPVTINCEYFKSQRHILGVRKLRRNLMSQQLKEIQMEWLRGERIVANEMVLEASLRSMLYLKVLLDAVPY